MERSPSSEAVSHSAGHSPPFMEPEGSLPCSQQHTSRPYPVPVEVGPHSDNLSFKLRVHFNIIHPSTPRSCKCPLPFRFFEKNRILSRK
jgi:hypothetical protein